MTNPYICSRRASSLETIFPEIDARRWEWAAAIFAELGRPMAAERALAFAEEYRLTADRLSGATPIGEDVAEATASAIAFGGPLPTGRTAA
jgi:hypothetical protein